MHVLGDRIMLGPSALCVRARALQVRMQLGLGALCVRLYAPCVCGTHTVCMP